MQKTLRSPSQTAMISSLVILTSAMSWENLEGPVVTCAGGHILVSVLLDKIRAYVDDMYTMTHTIDICNYIQCQYRGFQVVYTVCFIV